MEGRVRTAVAATTSRDDGDAVEAADDGMPEVNYKKPVLEQPSTTFGYTTSSR